MSQFVGLFFGMAVGALIMLCRIQIALKKAHNDIVSKMDQQHVESSRLQASVEGLIQQVDAIRKQGER